jgi:hypothetical protein
MFVVTQDRENSDSCVGAHLQDVLGFAARAHHHSSSPPIKILSHQDVNENRYSQVPCQRMWTAGALNVEGGKQVGRGIPSSSPTDPPKTGLKSNQLLRLLRQRWRTGQIDKAAFEGTVSRMLQCQVIRSWDKVYNIVLER